MPDSLTRLRAADPVAFLRNETDVDGPPPVQVLAAIVATPLAKRRRRPPRLAVAAVAAAALATLAIALVPDRGGNLAARAYAATAPPADAVIYTQTTLVSEGPEDHRTVSRTRTWQRGDRLHDVMEIVQDGRRWRYEHEQRGDVFRTLVGGHVESIRADDRGWAGDEGRKGFADNLETVVEHFRRRYPGLRDAGETTFAGRPARAYTSEGETFYVDRETALPLGRVTIVKTYGIKLDPSTRRPVQGEPKGETRITETVDRFEHLPTTPANLALLDAPAIDAAAKR